MNNYWIRLIPPSLIHQFWKHGEAYIKRRLDKTNAEYTIDDLRTLCENGVLTLYFIGTSERVRGTVLLRPVAYTTKRHCRVVILSGKGLDEWLPLADQLISDFAREQQCEAIEIAMPPAMLDHLHKHGYRQSMSLCYKKLDHAQLHQDS